VPGRLPAGGDSSGAEGTLGQERVQLRARPHAERSPHTELRARDTPGMSFPFGTQPRAEPLGDAFADPRGLDAALGAKLAL